MKYELLNSNDIGNPKKRVSERKFTTWPFRRGEPILIHMRSMSGVDADYRSVDADWPLGHAEVWRGLLRKEQNSADGWGICPRLST